MLQRHYERSDLALVDQPIDVIVVLTSRACFGNASQ